VGSVGLVFVVILGKNMFFIGIDVSKAKLDCSLLLDVTSAKRRAKSVAKFQIW
jgi:hypothetical protein